MRHLNKILFASLTALSLNVNAQDSDNPWALSFGVNAIDTKGSAGGGKNKLDYHFSNFFNVEKNWNIIPSVSYLKLERYVGSGFSVGLQGSVNKLSKFVYFAGPAAGADDRGYIVTNPGDLSIFGLDLTAKYSFMSLIGSKVIDPYISAGGGHTWLDKKGYFTANPGAGLTVWFSENVGLSLGSQYKIIQIFGLNREVYTPTGVKPVEPSYFQHTLGLSFKFGGKDTDGDGIYDKNDSCPEVAGLKQFNGCPDTDADGIIDGSDACPSEFGLAALNGCPDKDSDGIADKDDACPEIAGTAAFKGCVDSDGDGIVDGDDKCPKQKGPKSNGGCPILDGDNDGVNDKEDNCPTVAGTVANKGCPEVSTETLKKLNDYGKTILFNSGKSTFQTETFAVLESITEILKEYPTSKFEIVGHTDSDGAATMNQTLSENRASAVTSYLVEKGIAADRLQSKGFGETMPVTPNKDAKSKAMNRRVEITLIK